MPFSDERSPVSSGTVPGERHIQEHLEITSSLQIVIRNKVEAEIDLIPTTSQKTNRLQSLWTVPFGGEENGSDRSATYCSAGTSPAKRTKGGDLPPDLLRKRPFRRRRLWRIDLHSVSRHSRDVILKAQRAHKQIHIKSDAEPFILP